MQAQQEHYFVYIYGDPAKSDLNIGVSDNLHQFATAGGHPAEKPKLVYYEHYDMKEVALVRERHIRAFSMEEAARLVETMNPNWLDLSDTLY